MMSPDLMSDLLPLPPHWVSLLRGFVRDNPEFMRELNTSPIPQELVERWRTALAEDPEGMKDEQAQVLKEFVANMMVFDRMSRLMEPGE